MAVGIAPHLTSRAVQGIKGLDAASSNPFGGSFYKAWHVSDVELSRWAIPVFVVTTLLFMVAIGLVAYTYGCIVATLTIIESRVSQRDAKAPIDANEKLVEDVSELEPGLNDVPVQHVTSTIRSTMKHLRARAGRLSRFRGLGLHLFISWLIPQLVQVFRPMLPFQLFLGPFLAAFCATVLLTPLHITLTHIWISEPSSKSWIRRIPSRATWIKALPATALEAGVTQLWFMLPYAVARCYDLTHPTPRDIEEGMVTALKLAILVMVVLVGSWFWMVLPASVVLVRVQASLLSESEEAIVPFDRTFDGLVVPESRGGSGKLGIRDAWRSFKRADRVRLLKLYGKIMAIQLAIFTLFYGIYVAEARLFVGKVSVFAITPSVDS